MTWRGYLKSVTLSGEDALSILVQFYDSDDAQNAGVGTSKAPVVVLDIYGWQVPAFPVPTLQSLRDEAQRMGKRKRDAAAARDSLLAAAPVGTTVPIP